MGRWKFPCKFILNVVPVAPVLDRLREMESIMSDQSDAFIALNESIAGVVTRVDADVANLRALLEAALATDPDQSEEIERLKADADRVVGQLAAATEALNAIDPDTAFPAPEAPPVA